MMITCIQYDPKYMHNRKIIGLRIDKHLIRIALLFVFRQLQWLSLRCTVGCITGSTYLYITFCLQSYAKCCYEGQEWKEKTIYCWPDWWLQRCFWSLLHSSFSEGMVKNLIIITSLFSLTSYSIRIYLAKLYLSCVFYSSLLTFLLSTLNLT